MEKISDDIIIKILSLSNNKLNLLCTCKRFKKLAYGRLTSNRIGWLDIKDGLRTSCENGYLNLVKLLLLDPRVMNEEDNSLELACLKGHLEIVKILIKDGRFNKQHALEAACHSGRLEIVEFLIFNYSKNILSYIY